MRKLALLAAATLAATTLSSPVIAQVSLTSADINNPFTISFNGFVDQGGTIITGLTSELTLTLTSIGAGDVAGDTDWTFTYSLANTSGSPLTGAVVTAFGFDSSLPVDLSTSSVTGTYGIISDGQISQGSGFDVDICAKNGQDNNCAGSPGNTGVAMGDPAGTGTLVLEVASLDSLLTLSDFTVRYQAITGPEGTPGSAIGQEVPVPEPATWAMMLLGFGATGYSMRRTRRRKVLLEQIA